MRTYNQESSQGIPSNYPLKSPSPDFKAKNTLHQTYSPHNQNLRKSYDFTPPPNRTKKPIYFQYSTLPHFHQEISQDTEQKIQKIFSNTKNDFDDQKHYSSTHAKGHYVFDMPQDNHLNFDQKTKDMMTTGKKMQSNQTKFNQSQSPLSAKNNEYLKVIKEKDIIISQLKDMINLMTQNGKHLKISQRVYHEQQYENMKNEVKILTIQNQKLSDVIDKLKEKNQFLTKNQQSPKIRQKKMFQEQKQASFNPGNTKDDENNLNEKLKQFQSQVKYLKQVMQQKEMDFKNQLSQIRKINQDLKMECKFFQNQKQRFSKENESLINLLKLKDKQKETCYKNYSYFDKQKYEGNSQSNPKNTSLNNKNEQTPTGMNKLSIQKIKAQYEENLKLYKQNVYNEVYMMFDTINLTLEEINQKVNDMEQKIVEMQKFRHTWKQRVRSHLTSIEQNEQEIKKSAIYIQDAPSSQRLGSSSGKSRQALSVILEESRRDNQKLQLEISQLKKQVEYYKQTLQQKLTMKSSESQQELTESYQMRIREMEGLLDELREEKETLENQLTEMKMQMIKSQQLNQQSTKLTILAQQQQNRETPQHNDKVKMLQQQIQILTQKLQLAEIEGKKLLQKLKQIQMKQSMREKQLLAEIQRFQALIKQTERQFKETKQEYENEISAINQQLDYLKSQEIKIKMDNMLLKKENQTLSQKLDSLQKSSINIQTYAQKVQKIKSIINSYQSKLNHDESYETIKTYLQTLQQEIINKNRDQNELIKIIESQKEQILSLEQNKIQLTQKITCLQENVKLYKAELQKTKQFYTRFLQANDESSNNDTKKEKQNHEGVRKKSNKTLAKQKIQQVLNSERKKISFLIDSLDNLTN